jgi:hypothetical protein
MYSLSFFVFKGHTGDPQFLRDAEIERSKIRMPRGGATFQKSDRGGFQKWGKHGTGWKYEGPSTLEEMVPPCFLFSTFVEAVYNGIVDIDKMTDFMGFVTKNIKNPKIGPNAVEQDTEENSVTGADPEEIKATRAAIASLRSNLVNLSNTTKDETGRKINRINVENKRQAMKFIFGTDALTSFKLNPESLRKMHNDNKITEDIYTFLVETFRGWNINKTAFKELYSQDAIDPDVKDAFTPPTQTPKKTRASRHKGDSNTKQQTDSPNSRFPVATNDDSPVRITDDSPSRTLSKGARDYLADMGNGNNQNNGNETSQETLSVTALPGNASNTKNGNNANEENNNNGNTNGNTDKTAKKQKKSSSQNQKKRGRPTSNDSTGSRRSGRPRKESHKYSP